jgi:hypothetical protein
VSGLRQPEFKGMSDPISERRQYKMALFVIDLGAFVFPITSNPVPLKSKIALF